MHLWYRLTNNPISSSSESSLSLVPLSSYSFVEDLELEATIAINFLPTSFSLLFSFLTFFSFYSKQMSSYSCYSSLPKKLVVSNVNRLLASLMAMTLGCHSLLRHLKILLVASSLETGLSSAFKRFARWVNLFCISTMVSQCYIWKSLDTWFKVLILACLTSFVPSW